MPYIAGCNVSRGVILRRFTSPRGLASVSEEPERACHGYADLRQGPAVYAAAESGCVVFVRGAARALDRVPARVVYRGTRSRPESEAHVVHDPATRGRRCAAPGGLSVPLRGSVARRRVPDGFAGRPRGGADWRRDYNHSGAGRARMAGHAGGVHGGTARRLDAPGDSQQGRSLELRAVHVFEYSARRSAPGAAGRDVLGIAAAARVRWTGTWARGAGGGHKTQVAVCDRAALGLVAGIVRAGHADVGGGAAEDLEQHAHRNESGAAPAVAAEGAHGRAFEPDQSALFVQYAEHGVVADPL